MAPISSKSTFFALFLLILSLMCQTTWSFSFGAETIFYAGIGALTSTLYRHFNIAFIGCSFSECCSTKTGKGDWIPFNIPALSKSLDSKLHGQHLVKDVVVRALRAHYADDQPRKALVLSFHGWTGGGKNFVSRLIAESIYKNGMKSKFVHLFVSTIDFPHEDKVDVYRLQVQDWIRGNVSECEHSMFIFDEIDKMPVKMISGIKPFIDYHEKIFDTDFRKSVFIFLSNTGGRDIIKKMLEDWKAGLSRSDIIYVDMEDLIQKGAFNEEGGLHQSDLIQHSLIDFYVPFLPLERKHVESCVKDELLRRERAVSASFIKKVVDSMTFFPPENQLYSTRGCKSVSTKVGYFLTEESFDKEFA